MRILRSVDMPLDEIRAILETDDPEIAHKHLVVHRERLAERLETQERMLAYLESLINNEEQVMPYEIQIEEVQPQLIAATKIHTSLAKIGQDIGAGFGSVVHALGKAEVEPSGAPLIVYHEVIDQETDGDIEISVPVAAPFEDDGDVYGRELEGGAVASTTHTGPYEEIAPAYHALTTWISENGHGIAGPPREIYINDPQFVAPSELLTKVEFPIMDEAG